MRNTYLTTDLNQLVESEIESMLPEVFDILYKDIFGTAEGWSIKSNVKYLLKKLIEWRELGAGPKIGIVSNFDERLPKILKGIVI